MLKWTDEDHIRMCRVDNVRHVYLSGDLDMNAVDRLPSAETVAAEGDFRGLSLDLTNLDYIDSTGLRWVLRMHRAAVARAIPMVIRAREESLVLRSLSLIGADGLVSIEVVPAPLATTRPRTVDGDASV